MRSLRVTMLLYGEIEHDSRVRREASSLRSAGHRVTVATLAATSAPPFELDGARIVPLRPARQGLVPGDDSPFRSWGSGAVSAGGGWLGRGRWAAGYAWTFAHWTRTALRRLPPADVWHGHDLLGLLAARQLQRRHGGGLVHDSHELFIEAGSAAHLPRPARSALARLERGATRAADAVITVNDSIAAELRERYGVRPIVVMNCPPLAPLPERPRLRQALDLGRRPIVIYHGALNGGRGVEQLIEAVPLLPTDVAVVLIGDGVLARPAAERAGTASHRDRLFVRPAVPIADLAAWICEADVGVIAFQPVDRNNVLGTPNKLFEYLEAGVPMVVSDFPELRRIVTETGAGIAADTTTPEALAAAIARLLGEPEEARAARRAAARAAAESRYNWQTQAAGLLAIYERMASRVES